MTSKRGWATDITIHNSLASRDVPSHYAGCEDIPAKEDGTEYDYAPKNFEVISILTKAISDEKKSFLLFH